MKKIFRIYIKAFKSVDSYKEYEDLKKYMKNKKVLVTGCDGFVAKKLIDKLLKLKFTVVGIYKKELKSNKNKNSIKHKKFLRIKLDINKKKKYFLYLINIILFVCFT